MDVAAFCTESRVLVVAGKGGVGKTTVAAAVSRMAAEAGLSVLLVELEGRAGLGAAFGVPGPLGYEESSLFRTAGGGVRGRRITPDDALLEYLADHGLQRVSKRLVSSGVVDVVATAIPGIRDVLVLGKVKRLERDRVADLLVVDAPATGHAVTFLTSPAGLLDAARSGPVRAQAADVVELLHDPSRCRVLLVTLPEEMPVSETVEAAYLLEDKAGVRLGPVIVNCWDEPPVGLRATAAEAAAEAGLPLPADEVGALEAARAFRLRRHELAAAQVERLGRELPLPQLRIPALAAPAIGPDELALLVGALGEGVAELTPQQGAA
ncbi:MAG: ArsA family ATPase [Acidimicrobiales bacterium]